MYHRRQKGYIEQQIEAIALVLARIIGLKENRDFPAAQIEVGKAFQNLAGLTIPTVLALPESMVKTSFWSGGQIDVGRALAAAMLLEEHASIIEEQNLLASSTSALRRALELYCECVETEESLRTPEYETRIYGILTRLGENDLTDATRRRLKMPF